MTQNTTRPVESAARDWRRLTETAIIAIVLASGISLSANALTNSLEGSNGWLWIVALVCLISGASLFAFRGCARNSHSYLFIGYACIDESGKVTAIPEYDFSANLAQSCRSLFAEDSAYERIWTEAPIGVGVLSIERGKLTASRQSANKLNANEIIRQSTEYYFLKELSLHTNSFFAYQPEAKKYVTTIERQDIPEALARNAFLDTFSRSPNEREKLASDNYHRHEDEPHGKVVYFQTADGIIFDHFSLELPNGSSIKTENDGTLHVITPLFCVSVNIAVQGTSGVLPMNFERLYLKSASRELHPFNVQLRIRVEMTPWRLAFHRNLELYRWLDGFVQRLESGFDFDGFLEHINWRTASTIGNILANRWEPRLFEGPCTDTAEQNRIRFCDGGE